MKIRKPRYTVKYIFTNNKWYSFIIIPGYNLTCFKCYIDFENMNTFVTLFWYITFVTQLTLIVNNCMHW